MRSLSRYDLPLLIPSTQLGAQGQPERMHSCDCPLILRYLEAAVWVHDGRPSAGLARAVALRLDWRRLAQGQVYGFAPAQAQLYSGRDRGDALRVCAHGPQRRAWASEGR